MACDGDWENWARTVKLPGTVRFPSCVEEVVDVVRSARRVQVVGKGHSFHFPHGHVDGDGPDAVLDLSVNMGRILSTDPVAKTCIVEGGCTFDTAALQLKEHGLALENTASLTSITVAGAVLTGTHGSGRDNCVLAELVTSMQVVTGQGEVLELDSDQRPFFLHLGLLGVVTRLTLRCVPFFNVEQQVYEHVPWTLLSNRLPEVLAQSYSLSCWVDLATADTMVWQRFVVPDQHSCQLIAREPPAGLPLPHILGCSTARLRVQPLPSAEDSPPITTSGCGPWYELLPFFPPGSSLAGRGRTVQAEFFVPLARLAAAFEAVRVLPGAAKFLPQGSELRFVRADKFTMSPCGQHSHPEGEAGIFAGIHFTLDNRAGVMAVVAEIEQALQPFEPRPHWAKLFTPSSTLLSQLYGSYRDEMCARFWALVRDLDPDAKFRNAHFDSLAREATPLPACVDKGDHWRSKL